jgi:hypothetical protein
LLKQPFLKGTHHAQSTTIRQACRDHVAPVVSPMPGVLIAFQQPVYQPGALAGISVGDELVDIGR